MRPSTFRPSIMTPEGLALLDSESLAVRYGRHPRTTKARAQDLRPLMASVRTMCRTTVQLIIPAEDTADRVAMQACISRQLARRAMQLSVVLDYGDGSAIDTEI